jgi:toxin-antitoxin system, antitoxin component, xre family
VENIKTLDQIKDEFYGVKGTPKREELERELESLRIGLKIREAREQRNMTQEQLANRIDKRRSYISKIETNSENITLKTLFDIVERGLGGKLKIDVSF